MTPSPTTPQQFDFIVIGAGPVGETFGQKMAAAGSTVAIVEHQLVGGDCAYFACKPSKALLRPVEVAANTRHLDGLEDSSVVPEELIARRNEQVNNYDDQPQIAALEGAGLRVFRGHGQLAGERTVEIHASDHSSQRLEANRAVVITTGTTPNIPEPYQGIPLWNSKDATAVQTIPERLVVVGGGPVACESASWMAALGSQVTMLVRGGSLLSGFEPFVSDLLTDRLTEAGIDVRFYTEATQVQRPEGIDHGLGNIKGGSVTVRTNTDEILHADELLLATGRRPDLDAINLASVNLTQDDVFEGRLPDWLMALGDASGQHQLTHMGKYQALNLVAQLTQSEVHRSETAAAPTTQVVFTDPQIASVGMTESAARAAGYDVIIGEADFADVVGATLLRDDIIGQAKIVVDRKSNCLVGATFVGPETAEMLHAATIAIVGRVSVDTLRHAVPVFPTASEIWLGLLAAVDEH